MTASSFANVLARQAYQPRERTEQAAWRGSWDVEDQRAQVVMPFAGRSRHDIYSFITWYMTGLRQESNRTKKPGKAHSITHNALAVVEALLRKCTDFKTGRCIPSLERIMEHTGFARDTVVKLLKRARELMGLDWARRTYKTGVAQPAVKQTSNAYFINLAAVPKRVMMQLRQKLLGKFDFDALAPQTGSPRLPSWRERRAAAIVANAASATHAGGQGLQADLRRRAETIASASLADRAAAMWPDDPEAQQFFEEAMRAASGPDASPGSRLQWGVNRRIQKE